MLRINCFILFALSFGCFFLGHAQDLKRTHNWYFGDMAGLSFATDSPTVLNDGMMSTDEGCATISDTSGNLLFYTNGLTIWNKNHVGMDNGSGLLGHWSSTQSSLIVPWPDNDSLYFVFTTDAHGSVNGLRHSLVNIKENSGLGRVISKNNALLARSCEKLTATHHENGKDIWVLAHGFPNNSFYAYLVTAHGLITCPIISEIGSVHGIKDIFGQIPPTDAQGGMKLSTSGKFLSVSVFGLSKTELFQFDKQSGKVSNLVSLPNTFLSYCSEFSPNDSFLYIIDRSNNVYQYNISIYDQNAIGASRKIINHYPSDYVKGIQLAPNGRIYISPIDSFSLDVIQYPDLDSQYVNYSQSGQLLSQRAALGLPNFITSYFNRDNKKLRYWLSCEDYSGNFSGYSENSINSWRWEFKNVNGDLIGTAFSRDTTFLFPDTGTYIVQMIADADTVTKIVRIEPRIELGNDTILCNSGISLSVLPEYRCLQWQDGSDSTAYYASESGKYYVSGYTNKGCLLSDTIQVHISNPEPVITQSDDTLFADTGYTYRWFYQGNLIAGENNFLKVNQNGVYNVEITDSNGCTGLSDDFTVTGISVREVEQSTFNIFPNPSEEGSEAFITGDEWITDIKVFDMSGKVIYQENNINAFEYKLIRLKKGSYILTINSSFNYRLIVK